MPKLITQLLLAILLIGVITTIVIAVQWYLIPLLSADWQQAIAAIVTVVIAVISVVGGLLRIAGFDLGKFHRSTPTLPPPLRAITTEQLFDDLTDDGQVLWLDRHIVTLDHLRSPNGCLILTGPFKTGKTREAVQLIQTAQVQGLVARDRIFEPDITFAQRTPAELRAALPACLDPRRPALVFVDDLPRYHFGDGLKLLDVLLDALQACPHGYFVATAREDELTDEHRAWLKDRPEPIRQVPLPAWQPNHLVDLAGLAASRSQVQLLPGAGAEFASVTDGAPEVIVQAMQQPGAQAAPVDPSTAREWAGKSLTQLWHDLRLKLRRQVPASRHLFDALAAFRYARVGPSTPLIFHYAAHLWRQDSRLGRPWFARRALRRALPRLRHFSVEQSAGALRCDDAPLEGLTTPDHASASLERFLTRHRRLFHTPPSADSTPTPSYTCGLSTPWP